jgi:hypothetical protein
MCYNYNHSFVDIRPRDPIYYGYKEPTSDMTPPLR